MSPLQIPNDPNIRFSNLEYLLLFGVTLPNRIMFKPLVVSMMSASISAMQPYSQASKVVGDIRVVIELVLVEVLYQKGDIGLYW